MRFYYDALVMFCSVLMYKHIDSGPVFLLFCGKTSEAANRKVHHNSDAKVYNSNNKIIKYEFLHATTPGYTNLGETPYKMELMIKQVENGKTIDKKVFSHTGIEPTPEMQQKYEEAKKGLISLEDAQDKYDSMNS